jgi:hypothetical protein
MIPSRDVGLVWVPLIGSAARLRLQYAKIITIGAAPREPDNSDTLCVNAGFAFLPDRCFRGDGPCR